MRNWSNMKALQEAAAAAAAAASGRLGAHVQSLGANAGPPHPLEGTLRTLRYPDWQLQPQAPQPPRVRVWSCAWVYGKG